MKEQTIRLESLRQQAQAFETLAGSLYDYLDHGMPDEQQKLEAFTRISEYEHQAVMLKAQLSELLADLRADVPHVVEEWARWHMSICERIVAETAGAGPDSDGLISDAQVRNYVAGQTLGEWQKVLEGAQDFVVINHYYLRDYHRKVTTAVAMDHP